MNDFWDKVTIFCLLVMFVLAPFAGFAPLLLIVLFAGIYWFFAPVIQALFGKKISDRQEELQLTFKAIGKIVNFQILSKLN